MLSMVSLEKFSFSLNQNKKNIIQENIFEYLCVIVVISISARSVNSLRPSDVYKYKYIYIYIYISKLTIIGSDNGL